MKTGDYPRRMKLGMSFHMREEAKRDSAQVVGFALYFPWAICLGPMKKTTTQFGWIVRKGIVLMGLCGGCKHQFLVDYQISTKKGVGFFFFTH